MVLTKTEKRFIKTLLETKETNFSIVAKNLKITKQAVSKIKKKLEEKDILKSWSVNIDVNKIGITIYSVIQLGILNNTSLNSLIEYLKERKEVIQLMESTLPNTKIIMMCGFKQLKDIDNIIYDLKREYSDIIGHISVQLVHPKKIHKDTRDDLVLHSISEKIVYPERAIEEHIFE